MRSGAKAPTPLLLLRNDLLLRSPNIESRIDQILGRDGNAARSRDGRSRVEHQRIEEPVTDGHFDVGLVVDGGALPSSLGHPEAQRRAGHGHDGAGPPRQPGIPDLQADGLDGARDGRADGPAQAGGRGGRAVEHAEDFFGGGQVG